MENVRHPCADGLTAACFKAEPHWARQAMAYRILQVVLPDPITKRLPKDLIKNFQRFYPDWQVGDPWPPTPPAPFILLVYPGQTVGEMPPGEEPPVTPGEPVVEIGGENPVPPELIPVSIATPALGWVPPDTPLEIPTHGTVVTVIPGWTPGAAVPQGAPLSAYAVKPAGWKYGDPIPAGWRIKKSWGRIGVSGEGRITTVYYGHRYKLVPVILKTGAFGPQHLQPFVPGPTIQPRINPAGEYALGLFVAVASSGTGSRVMTSPNGKNWTLRTTPEVNVWNGVTWSPKAGLFCAVASWGETSLAMTSPNGTDWTLQEAAAAIGWQAVCWAKALGLFVAVANDGEGNGVMTSPDGVTWTARTPAADLTFSAVCWSPELALFVAVAAAGAPNQVMTSPNGTNWTLRATPGVVGWRGVTWAKALGRFVAVAGSGDDDRVMTSPNGINWTGRAAAAQEIWTSVAWSPAVGRFVAVAESGATSCVMTSPNGIDWTSRAGEVGKAWKSVCWSPALGLFVAVASEDTVNCVMTSPNGIDWTLRAAPAGKSWKSICWAP